MTESDGRRAGPASTAARASRAPPPGSARRRRRARRREPAASAARSGSPPSLGRIRPGRPLAVAAAALLVALIVGVSVGPADLSPSLVGQALLARLPWHPAVSVPPIDSAIVWQIRVPRVLLGALVGAMLAGGGAAYQGVFRNPLADPYLLGVAAGGGLGATLIIVTNASIGAAAARRVRAGPRPPPRSRTCSALARAGAASHRASAAAPRRSCWPAWRWPRCSPRSRTYLQQQHSQTLPEIYSWILGELSLASWSDIAVILPYVVVSAGLLIAHRRLLDVLRVGEAEAASLGVNVARLRLTVVLAATLGTAAAVSVSGLIGFVGIIVPHTVRLTAGASYRIVLPVSMVGGAAFLVLADVAARTVQAPAEVPIGVITAIAGAPFFLFVLRSRRTRRDLS